MWKSTGLVLSHITHPQTRLENVDSQARSIAPFHKIVIFFIKTRQTNKPKKRDMTRGGANSRVYNRGPDAC